MRSAIRSAVSQLGSALLTRVASSGSRGGQVAGLGVMSYRMARSGAYVTGSLQSLFGLLRTARWGEIRSTEIRGELSGPRHIRR